MELIGYISGFKTYESLVEGTILHSPKNRFVTISSDTDRYGHDVFGIKLENSYLLKIKRKEN